MSDAPVRLRQRHTSILARSYLTYRALWPLLEDEAAAVLAARGGGAAPLVLDIGCGERPYADLFAGARYVGLDYGLAGAAPDVVGSAEHLPFADGCADIVFSTQVIEHVREPQRLVQEAYRVLKPGGMLLLSGPFFWPLHEEPHDYFRFTPHGLRHLLGRAGFDVLRIRPDAGALTQAAVALVEVLPRTLFFLVPLINLVTPLLQRLSRNDKSTLNYVLVAARP